MLRVLVFQCMSGKSPRISSQKRFLNNLIYQIFHKYLRRFDDKTIYHWTIFLRRKNEPLTHQRS